MPEACEADGVIVFCDDEVVVAGVVDCPFVVHVGVVPQLCDFLRLLDAAFVDGHELFVQVIEGCAGGFQPVLEGCDIGHVAVGSVEVGDCFGGEADECAVFVDA